MIIGSQPEYQIPREKIQRVENRVQKAFNGSITQRMNQILETICRNAITLRKAVNLHPFYGCLQRIPWKAGHLVKHLKFCVIYLDANGPGF